MECDACKEDNFSCSSICYCKECNEYLCQQHLVDHKASRSARKHVIISVSEGDSAEKDAEINYVAIKNFWENKSRRETSTQANKTAAVQKIKEVNYSDKVTTPKELKHSPSSSIGNNREVDEIKLKETAEESTSYNTSTNAGGSDNYSSSEMLQVDEIKLKETAEESTSYNTSTSAGGSDNYSSSEMLQVVDVKLKETVEQSSLYSNSTNAGGIDDYASSEMLQGTCRETSSPDNKTPIRTNSELCEAEDPVVSYPGAKISSVTPEEEGNQDRTSSESDVIYSRLSKVRTRIIGTPSIIRTHFQANEVKLNETAGETTSYNTSTNAGGSEDCASSEMLQFQAKVQNKEEVTYFDKDTTPNELHRASSTSIGNHRGDANRTKSIQSTEPDFKQEQISKCFDGALKVKHILQQEYDELSTNDEQSDILSESGTNDYYSILSSVSESGTEADSSYTEDYYTSFDPADTVSEVGSTVTIVGENPIEYMVEVYLPHMKHVINVGDIITSLHFVSKRDADIIRSKHKFCACDAFEQLIKVIRKSDFAGKWQTFLDALGQNEYEHIKLLLERKTEIHHQHNSEILKLLAPELKRRMDVKQFIDDTFETGLLTEEDKAEAQAQLREHGEYAAANIIIDRVDRHKTDWNTILIKIMEKDEHSLSDMADCFKMIQQTEPNIKPKGATYISKTTRSESLEQRDWRLQNLKVAEPHLCNESSLENLHGNASSRRDDITRKDLKKLTSEFRKVRKAIEKK